MPTPSLLIVPARFKTGRLYSQLPTSGAGDFTVTRATAATRVNASGLIVSVASGIPRLDYFASGGTVGCPALLVEPSGTNVLSYSEEFDNAAWGKSGMTVSTGTTAAFTAPDGTTNADKIIATSGNVAHNINRSGLTSAAYTFSVFAKAGEESVISLWLRGASVRAEFNLVSGTVSNITTTSARIDNYGNGWYRCTVYDSTAGTTAHIYGRGGGAYAGNGSDGFYLWGAQLETGSVATSYIPTTTGSITRNADVISVSGAVSGSIGQTEGTLYAEIVAQPYNNALFPAILQVDDGADSQRFAIFINASGGIRVRLNASGINVGQDSTNIPTLVAGQTYKIAAAFGFNGSQALYINGVFQVSGSVAAGPFTATLNRVMLGHRAGVSSPFLIRSAALYTTRLTNAQLAALTTP